MNWEITPLVGLGPLKFGMSPKEVARIEGLGPVTDSHTAYDNSLNEFRTMDVPVCNYVDGLLAAVDTNHLVENVKLDGIDVYQTSPERLVKMLERLNRGAKIGLGSILFNEIGINISGFYLEEEAKFFDPGTGDIDERGLGMFRKGGFDPYLNEYRTINFLDR